MDKLIELLTEHCRKHYGFKDNDDIEIDTDSVCFHLYHKGKRYFSIRIETVICKDFGFIKWLVDNDKIDRESENYPLKKYYPYFNDDVLAIVSQDCNTYEDECRVCYYKYESLLMLLSIQDNPIEFLISILK